MPYPLVFTEDYTRRALRFLQRRPELKAQYGNTLALLGTWLEAWHQAGHEARVFSLYDVLLNAGLVCGISVAAVVSPASGIAPGLWLVVGGLLVATALWTLRPLPASG